MPAWSEEIHAPLSMQEPFLGTNLLCLWPISFSLHIHECIESSETVRTGSLQKNLFTVFQWQVSLCTLLNVNTKSWNFREQCKWPVIFKSGCSFNWKVRYIHFPSHINQKLEWLWMLDGHFSPTSTKLQMQND